MLCYFTLRFVVLYCYVMLCHVMLCYVMLCYVMLCYVMLCYVMLCGCLLAVVRLGDGRLAGRALSVRDEGEALPGRHRVLQQGKGIKCGWQLIARGMSFRTSQSRRVARAWVLLSPDSQNHSRGFALKGCSSSGRTTPHSDCIVHFLDMRPCDLPHPHFLSFPPHP